jgi:hypothetical protein
MLAVVHHRRVAGAGHEPREGNRASGPAGVAETAKPIACAPPSNPADLEDRDHGLAERERVGLDLGRVLALAGAERVARRAW